MWLQKVDQSSPLKVGGFCVQSNDLNYDKYAGSRKKSFLRVVYHIVVDLYGKVRTPFQ